MARKLKSDRILFTATVLLVCLSVVMVYSASAALAFDRFGHAYMFLTRQAMWTVLGLVALAASMRINYRHYRHDTFIWASTAIIGVLLVLVLFSAPVNGARRWFNFGGLGFQPSEIAKIVAVFFTAMMLERRMHRINELSYALLPIGIVIGVMSALILLQPDLGTALSIVMIVGVMLFAAGLNYSYIGLAVAAAVPALYIAIASEPYRLRRFMAFWNPEADPQGDGFQVMQSLIAVGTGGIFGRGLMGGVQKLFFLPEPHTDFIYAVIGEELGLLGATAVLACFCVIAWRGVRVAMRAEDAFGSFVALGLTTMICAQALVNISVVLGLLPTKGITLPLVSSGGSSLLVSLIAIGVLLNISQHQET